MKSLSRVRLFVTPWTVAYQASQSMGFYRQEYWSGFHFLLQGIFLTQGSNLGLLHRRQILHPLSHQGSPDSDNHWSTFCLWIPPFYRPYVREAYMWLVVLFLSHSLVFFLVHLSCDISALHSYSVQLSCSVMSDSLRPHEPQHTRPPCPSPTPRVYPNSCPLSW